MNKVDITSLRLYTIKFSADTFHCNEGIKWEVGFLEYSYISGWCVPVDFTVLGIFFSVRVLILSVGGSTYG